MGERAEKGKLIVDFPKAIAEFENAIQKFPVKKILYKNVFRGKGLEFDSYRTFQPDDDASLIDWKASLRSNKILAKKYVEERELNVYFLVDVSSSMLFGSEDKLKAEYAAEFIVSLSHLILSAGDRIGLVMFNDDIVKFLPSTSIKSQFAMFTKYLKDSSLYGGYFDIKKAIEYTLRTVKSSYTIFIIVSDFIKVKKESSINLKLMGARFETIAVMIRDKLDERLPASNYQISMQDTYSGKQITLDTTIARDKYRHNVLKQKHIVKDVMIKSSIDTLELITNKSFTIALSNFLKSRARGTRV